MAIDDTRMMARAIIDRWPITSQQRELMIRVLLSIAADQKNSPRERTSAIKALIAADAVNMAQSKIVQESQHHHERLQSEQLDRIAAVAQQLGLTRVVDAIATERPGSDSVANVSAGGAATGHSGTR